MTILARENKAGARLPKGWKVFKSEVSLPIDGKVVMETVEIQAFNSAHAVKYCLMIAEHSGVKDYKFKLINDGK